MTGALLGVLALLLLGVGAAAAAGIEVNDPGDSGTNCTLRGAIDSANFDTAVGGCTAGSGADTITFDPGLSGQTITLTGGELALTSNLTIDGGGVITVSGNNLSQVFYVDTSGVVMLTGMTVRDGKAVLGGGIYNKGTLMLINSGVVSNSASSSGGGIKNSFGGHLIIDASTVASNTAPYGGGIDNGSNPGYSSTVTITNGSLVQTNIAPQGGGGIINSGDGSTLTILTSTVSSNTASGGPGGGIWNANGRVTIDVSTVAANTATNNGGGIYNQQSGAVTVTNSSILNNIAGNGGALYEAGGASNMTGSCIVNNSNTAVNYGFGTAIIATGNWWGDPSGPSGAGPGVGDTVSANVDFSGFLTAPILGCPTNGDPDLGIVKTVTPVVVTPGGTITYTLAFSNGGSAAATGVVVSDSTPVSVTITGVTSSTFGGGVFITQTSGAPDFAWAVSDLAVGAGGYITLTGTLTTNTALAGQILTNTATITASSDSAPGNNSSSAAPYRFCGPGTYVNTATNQCTAALPGFYVPDFGFTNALACDPGFYQPDSGQSSCLAAPVNTYVDSEGAAAPTPCPIGTFNPLQGSASVTACLALADALTVRKTVDNPTPDFGAVVTFTVAISNSSSLSLTNALLSDYLPNGLTFVDGSASLTPPDGGATLAGVSGDLPSLAAGLTITAGAAVTVTFQATVDTVTLSTALTNTVALSSTQMSAPLTDSVRINLAGGGACFATADEGATVFHSADAGAVRAGIAAASSGGIVKVAGYCAGVVADSGTTQVARTAQPLTLAGGYTTTNWTTADPPANPTTLDALGGGRVLYAAAPVTVTGLTVQNGAIGGGDPTCPGAGCGGGIYADATLALSAVRVVSNTATHGAGVHSNGVATVADSTFAHNAATGDGGGLRAASGGAVTGTTFFSNTAESSGGALFEGVTTVADSSFTENSSGAAGAAGGGYFNGIAALTNVTFTLNSAGTGGGGGAVFASDATVTGGAFVSNTADFAGGGAYFTSVATVTGATFAGNTATANRGGGAYFNGVATLSGASFSDNHTPADRGGGAYFRVAAAVDASSFVGNTASNRAGGAYFFSTATLTNTDFLTNTGTERAGGAYFAGLTTVTGGLFQANQCTVNCAGGGIFSFGALTLSSVELISNTTDGQGGGAYIEGSASLIGSTVAQNHSGADGGGIYSSAAAQVTGSSIFSNTAGQHGGGIANSGGQVTIDASTVASNTASAGNGGGLYATQVGAAITLTNGSRVQGNLATIGGGIYFDSGTAVAIDGSTVLANTALAGGGLYNESGTLQVAGSSIVSNTANQHGGGVVNVGGRVTIDASTVVSNTAGGVGGGFYSLNIDGAITVTNGSQVRLNHAVTGGGIAAAGQVTIDASSIATNTADERGGGLYATGIGTVISLTNGSQVQGNDAADGGGIYFNAGALVAIDDGSMVLANTAATNGGGLNNTGGTLQVADSGIFSNTAGQHGGGIANDGGLVTIAASTVASNTAAGTGGGITNIAGQITIAASSVASNTAASSGGGIASSGGAITLTNGSQVELNRAERAGGVSTVAGGRVTIDASAVTSNTADERGGGIFAAGASTVISLTNGSRVQGNRAYDGGGIYGEPGATVAIDDSLILANTAETSGGGLYSLGGTLRVVGSAIYSNTAGQFGGGVANDGGQVTIDASTVASNTTASAGGGLYNLASGGAITLTNGSQVQLNRADRGGGISTSGGSVTINASTIASNTAIYGGGAYLDTGAAVVIDDSTILANSATYGGGLLDYGSTLQVVGSNIVSNTASQHGGGIYNALAGSVRLDSSRVTSNTAQFGGGGILNIDSGSTISVTDSSLLANGAGNGGALFQQGGASSVTGSCIVENSDTAVDYAGGTAPLIATGNWWGHPSGPSGAGPGVGDSVSTLVDFSGFLNAAILGCPTFGDADVAITKHVAPALAAAGQTITYTLTFSNTGAHFARGVVISDSVPLSVTVTGVTSSTVGSGVVITQTSGSPDFAWVVGDADGDLDPGEGGIITLTGVVANNAWVGLVITNTAAITSSVDSSTGNNSGSASVTLARLDVYPAQPGVAPNGSVTISATLTPAQAGVTINFAIIAPGGGTVGASAVTDANGVAAVTFTAPGSAAVVQIEGSVASNPTLNDRAIVYVAEPTTAGGIETSASGVYTIGNLSPNYIQIVKEGAGTPVMGWAEFAGNPCPAAAPGSRVVTPYVDAMVEDATDVDAIVLTLRYTDTVAPLLHKLYWCNLGLWQPVTGTVSIDPLQQTLVFTITGATSPTLLQLEGTPFAGVGLVPTAATVGDFAATAAGEHVSLTWQTLSELGLNGFHLYRGLDLAGPGERITGAPVAAQGGGGLQGYAYRYDDFTPRPAGQAVYYWLEELHGDGTVRHGPLRVDAAGSLRIFLPAISLAGAAATAGEGSPPAPPDTATVENEAEPAQAPAPESMLPGIYLPLIGR